MKDGITVSHPSTELKDTVYAVEMPSNIALIKYMGKVAGSDRNRPTNSSISLTLKHLRSRVEIREISEPYDRWSTLDAKGWIPTQLSDRGRKRFIAHFEFLKQKLGIQGNFHIQSANNFPSDCGIASSASSFAALTSAAHQVAIAQNPDLDLSMARLAELSRVGSGSSIRSFGGPLVLWGAEGITEVDIPLKDLSHTVLIVEKEKKAIGSSDAHERVPSSLLFTQRPERATVRLRELLLAFQAGDWKTAFEVVWAEFWDMHALFATSRPVFGYMNGASLFVLEYLFEFWQRHGDGPLVTMDAGPNVHLIYRNDQQELTKKISVDLEKLAIRHNFPLMQL